MQTDGNDCALAAGNYKQEYAETLAKRDEDGEFLMRDYAHVWLHNPVTRLSSIASVGSVTRTPERADIRLRSAEAGTIIRQPGADYILFPLYPGRDACRPG